MSEDEGGEAAVTPLETLVVMLARIRRAAGRPTTREIARRTGLISHATVATVLNGQHLPPWETLRLIVEVLGGDEDQFRRLWESAVVTKGSLPQAAHWGSVAQSVGDLAVELADHRKRIAALEAAIGTTTDTDRDGQS